MSVVLRYSSIDNQAGRCKTFKDLPAARKYAHHWIGRHPSVGTGYAVSDDGIGRIEVVSGTTLAELFAPDRPAEPRTLTLTWRDENYGRISGVAAFRCYDTADLEEDEAGCVRDAFLAAGFEVNHTRACWMIDRGPHVVTRLVEELAAIGFSVEHKGAVPAFCGA